MLHRQFPSESESRRGVILMVVLILLTLFAIVGLSFALYADMQTQASRLYREAEVQHQPDIDAEMLFVFFLSQLLYDADDSNGVYSALRGHSLARNMYGYNYKRAGDDTAFVVPNNVPFNGLGRLHSQPGLTPTNPFGVDDYNLINYTFFSSDGFLRDPERRAARNNLIQPPGDFIGGFNAPYTYPDLNSMFLAAVKAGALTDAGGNVLAPPGAVLMPSFHRPWLFGRLTDPGNPKWSSPLGRYLTLRPRPADMSPGFLYPEDEGGDVKNLIGSPGYFDPVSGKVCNNDSIWIDLDFPVMIAPDGRKYKPLFAPLISDLDNRVNVNVHVNIRGIDEDKNLIHLSNQGWGPWEVSLSRVLDGDAQEWTHLFTGLKDANQPTPSAWVQRGRYGLLDEFHRLSTPHPHAPWLPNLSLLLRMPAPFYSPVDFDAASGLLRPSGPITLPAADGARFTCFPTYSASDYQGNSQNGLLSERRDHPLLYNYFQPAGDDRRRFLSSNMEGLLRYNDTGSPALTSELFRLCPVNFSGPGSDRRRNLVTTRSFDVDRPGVMPWAYPGVYQLQPALPYIYISPAPVAPQVNNGEYGPDGRASDASYGRIDLNRYLPPYPRPTDNGRIDITDPATRAQFNLAQGARVQLAKEIYDRLRLVLTGSVADPPPPANDSDPQTLQFNAMRRMAQLAVNIVDFIDSDDYMTPFNWYPKAYPGYPNGGWVFGTELPHLVLNEAYIEYDNDPSDEGTADGRATKPHWVNFWVELYNPFHKDPNLADSVSPSDPALYSAARLRMPETALNPSYGIYQLQIATGIDKYNASMNVVRTISDFSSADSNKPSGITDVVLASDPAKYGGAQGQNVNGFYVMGPDYGPGFPGVGPAFETLRVKQSGSGPTRNSMTYMESRISTSAHLANLPTYWLFLDRLACPHLPPNPDPTAGAFYNPYINLNRLEVQAYDGAKFSANEPGGHRPPPFTRRFSWGRIEPYSDPSNKTRQQQPNPPRTDQPQHTFFRHNGEKDPFALPSQTLSYPFSWPIHLDRPLVNPMELWYVSADPPSEFATPFLFGVAAGEGLYRVFEFLQAGNSALGTSAGGRVPGKININTIWDGETLLALCDPQPPNRFSSLIPALVYDPKDPANPDALFTRLVQARGKLDGLDHPFLGMATPYSLPGGTQFPSGSGIADTFLRRDISGRPNFVYHRLHLDLFDVPARDANQVEVNQYLQKEELKNKLFG